MLDEYERPLGIPPLTSEDEISSETKKILALQPTQLRKLSAIECAQYAFVLGQYSHRIQNLINREQARITWAEEQIKRIVAPIINQYRGISFEERKLQAIADNEAATKIDNIRIKAKLRIDRILFLCNRADNLAKTLMGIKNIKQEKGHYD